MGQGKNKILWWGEWGGDDGGGRAPNPSAIFSLRTFLEEVEGCSSIMSYIKEGGGIVVIVGGISQTLIAHFSGKLIFVI